MQAPFEFVTSLPMLPIFLSASSQFPLRHLSSFCVLLPRSSVVSGMTLMLPISLFASLFSWLLLHALAPFLMLAIYLQYSFLFYFSVKHPQLCNYRYEACAESRAGVVNFRDPMKMGTLGPHFHNDFGDPFMKLGTPWPITACVRVLHGTILGTMIPSRVLNCHQITQLLSIIICHKTTHALLRSCAQSESHVAS